MFIVFKFCALFNDFPFIKEYRIETEEESAIGQISDLKKKYNDEIVSGKCCGYTIWRMTSEMIEEKRIEKGDKKNEN